MLRSVRKGDDWYVLIMDELTVKIMSAACKMSEIADENVSRESPGRGGGRHRIDSPVGLSRGRGPLNAPSLPSLAPSFLPPPQWWRT